MAGKFSKQAEQFNLDLGLLFSRSIRMALLAGLVMAVRTTKHDSSNAAAHWLLAARSSRSRPGQRKWGKLRDLRERAGISNPPVGKRDSKGKNAALTERFVRDRELKEVLDKLVSGRRPETVFYFFNAIPADWHYGENANIEEAGAAAMAEVRRVFDMRIAAGQARKKPL